MEGLAAVKAVDADVSRLENNREARGEPRGDQILDHFLLRVDRDGLPAGEIVKIDAVAAPVEIAARCRDG